MTQISEIQGKLVAVLGYGLEGKAVTKYLIKHGIFPTVFDQRLWDEWPKEEQKQITSLGINFISGPDSFKELKGFDLAFRSPGIRIVDIKKAAPNLPLTSQTKWFFDNCEGKIIGVTGTKGKGTTSTLIYEMLKENQVFLTGNIGKEQPLGFLDKITKDYWVIYELSSFQLQDLEKSPHIGVVLMVTSEHLDYHNNIDEYKSAKKSIAKYQTPNDFIVINADFESSLEIGSISPAKKFYFSRQKQVESGAFVKEGAIWLAWPNEDPIEVCRTEEISLKGQHNLENICAAAVAARCAGADLAPIKRAAISFKGLEHRLEFVEEKNGVRFYNDSFSTTPETAIAAIQSFTEPLIVILGGSTKNSDFLQLSKTVCESENLKAVILIGQEGERIQSGLGKFKGQIIKGAQSMTEIFERISQLAKPGYVVLLSPACASFDMFKNYKDRGEQFKKFVAKY